MNALRAAYPPGVSLKEPSLPFCEPIVELLTDRNAQQLATGSRVEFRVALYVDQWLRLLMRARPRVSSTLQALALTCVSPAALRCTGAESVISNHGKLY